MNPGFTSFNVSLQCLKASSLFSELDDATLEHIVRRCRRERWLCELTGFKENYVLD